MLLNEGDTLVLSMEPVKGNEQNKTVSIDYPGLCDEIQAGARILVDDGLIELYVEEIGAGMIRCRVVDGGILKRARASTYQCQTEHFRNHEKDRRDLRFAFDNELEYDAHSFVRDSDDVRELQDIMLREFGGIIPIITKIEKPEAFRDINAILDASDAIMVARGDLGVETSPQEVPLMQKSIIRRCNLCGKPVITATQMLESMIQNPRPTRAEAGDVANAIFDGTDAIMLSGETAAGKYPVEAVKLMHDIARQVEKSPAFRRMVHNKLAPDDLAGFINYDIQEAGSYASIELADKIQSTHLAVFSYTEKTARKLSRYRPERHIIAFSPVPATVRRLSLVWGVIPLELGMVSTVDELFDGAGAMIKLKELAGNGNQVVMTAGVPVGTPGSTNIIKVVRI